VHTTSFGAQSMVDPLRRVLVKAPGDSFACAYDNPAHGFLHPVDLNVARREHEAFCALLADLGVEVLTLDGTDAEDCASPDLVYTFDPSLVTDRGYIALRSGKPTRLGEETVVERWMDVNGIPCAGRIEAPGTADGGDTFWLSRDELVVGRSLRTNRAGAAQLAELVDARVDVVDVPYAGGPGECLHLMSVISPVAPALAVVYLPLLPAGLYETLAERCIALVPVPDEELPTLGCNVLAVRPGVVVMADGNPQTAAALADRGCEVHTYAAREIGVNGSGGPTCLTRPLLRG
jgi:dimethylargininase